MTTLIFYGFIFLIVSVIFISSVGFENINSFFLLIIIWIMVLGALFTVKYSINKKETKSKDLVDILLSSFVSVFLIVGSTLAVASSTIVGRAFENTIGYWWINNEELTIITKSLFSSSMEHNYNIIATQLFYDSEKKQFTDYLKKMAGQENPFPGVTYNADKNTETNALFDMIAKKNSVSKAVMASLATIIAMHVGYFANIV
jgi:hypothetical protein